MKKEYTMTLAGGFKEAKNRPVKRKKRQDFTWYYLGLVGQIGYAIALPIAGGAIIGSMAGHTIIGILIGFIISVVGLIKIVQEVCRRYH